MLVKCRLACNHLASSNPKESAVIGKRIAYLGGSEGVWCAKGMAAPMIKRCHVPDVPPWGGACILINLNNLAWDFK
jgi:hypothetical protein